MKGQYLLLVLTSILLLAITPRCFGLTPNQPKAISIALNDWASQRVLSLAFGELLNRMDIEVQYHETTVEDQWGAFAKGFVDVQVETWQASSELRVRELIRKNVVVDAGQHIAHAREEWWYPAYVKSLCPELPKWQALHQCSHLFATDQSMGKGIYYTGPWNANEGIRIRSLNLNFNIKRLRNDAALWIKLSQAMAEKRPIMLLNWTPNWTDTRIKGEFVEFPPYHVDCIKDPSWGVNEKLPNDCANPKDGWVKKLASTRLEQQFSCAFSALKKMQFTTTMMAEAAALNIKDKYSEQEAAHRWIELFELQWLSWFPQDCMR